MTEVQPDFLIIGAAKAGTTWLQHCLRHHPDVYIPLDELQYFTRRYDRSAPPCPDPEWYSQHFQGAKPDQVIGENSNTYLSFRTTAKRIHTVLPNVKLVALLRNPVDRVYSGYCMQFRTGVADHKIENYLNPDSPTRNQHALEVGQYVKNLKPYLDLYPREQIHLALYDDIRNRPEALFAGVCDHIGVSKDAGVDVNQQVNTKSDGFVPRRVKRAASFIGPFRKCIDPLRKTTLYRQLRPLWLKQIAYPPMPDDLRHKLRDYYADDIEGLSELLGRDLSHWLEVKPRTS